MLHAKKKAKEQHQQKYTKGRDGLHKRICRLGEDVGIDRGNLLICQRLILISCASFVSDTPAALQPPRSSFDETSNKIFHTRICLFLFFLFGHLLPYWIIHLTIYLFNYICSSNAAWNWSELLVTSQDARMVPLQRTEPWANQTDANRPKVPIWLCEATRTQTAGSLHYGFGSDILDLYSYPGALDVNISYIPRNGQRDYGFDMDRFALALALFHSGFRAAMLAHLLINKSMLTSLQN